MAAAEAAKMIMDAHDPRGYEVIVPRRIESDEIKSMRAVQRVVGWRYYPEAKGKKPFCGCPSCTRGEIRAKRLSVSDKDGRMKRLASFLAAALVITSAAVTRADESADLVVARSWLAVVARDSAALGPTTAFPFTYRTTNKIKRCERVVRDASALKKWAACFDKEQQLLLGEIRAGATLAGVSTRDVEPKALRAIADRVPGDGHWCRAHITGDGVTFTFFFKVAGSGNTGRVSAVLLEEDVENG